MITNKPITITGYIVPPRKGEKDDSEDEEDDGFDFPDFEEMSAVADGGSYLNNSSAKRKTVTLKSLGRGRTERCRGKLVLSEPWWLLTASIQKRYDVGDIRSVSYKLRQDDKQGIHKLVTKFLLETSHNDPLVEEFVNFLEKNRKPKEMTFARLDDDLKLYMKQSGFHKYDDRRLSLLSAIWTQKQGKYVRFAMMYPHLFNITSKLLPFRFLSLAENVDGKLNDLEEATRTSIWELGFKQILGRKYGLYGIEAQMPAWQSSALIADVDPLYKDALYIYNALKLISKQENHTYISQATLKMKKKNFYQYSVTNWAKALDFLEENGVIVREGEGMKTNGSVKVYLASNFYAEVNAAKALAKVANVDSGPRYWKVDLASEDFAQIRTDEDQMKAVGQMSHSPVTILSGKGGCGKTSVVTTLLSHACLKSFQDNHPGRSLKSLLEELSHMPSNEEEKKNESENGKYEDDGNQEIKDTFLSKTPLGENILLTAPTGKAASLLGRKAKLKSCTLHSVIMSYRGYCIMRNKKRKEDAAKKLVRKFDSYHFNNDQMMEYLDAQATLREERSRENRGDNSYEESNKEPIWKHSSKSILVVDECSLVSVNTFATMMNILMKETDLRKIILLGDVRQLPSIEPGNFLGDIFEVFSNQGLGLELKTNHRAESELIVNNATRISKGDFPKFDSRRKFSLIETEDESDKAREDAIKKLLKTEDLQDHTTSQFITFTRKVVEAVNEMCCKHYTGSSQMEPGRKFKTLFKKGDKICLCKNGSVNHHYVRKIKRNENDGRKNEGDAEVEMENKIEVESKHCKDQNTPEIGRKTANIAIKRNLSIDFQNGGLQSAVGGHEVSVLSAAKDDRLMPDKYGDWNMPSYHGDRVQDLSGDNVEKMEFSERGDELCESVDMIPFEHFTDMPDKSHRRATSSNSTACNNNQHYQACQEQHVLGTSSSLKTSGKLRLRKNRSMSVRYRESQQNMESPSASGPTTSSATKVASSTSATATSPTSTISAENFSTSTSSAKATEIVSPTSTLSSATSSPSSSSATASPSSSSATASPSSAREDEEEASLKRKAKDFSVRSLERLCATLRDRAPGEDVDSKTDDFRIDVRPVKLSNGEIFFIEKDFNYTWPRNDVTRFLYINDRDPEKPRRFCVDFKQVMSECKMRHAWTRTIHTFQGSESEVVVYILGNIFYENWQHVYTAITRGRQSVYVVGTKNSLRRTIQQPASKRNTSLQEKLLQELEAEKKIKDKKKNTKENSLAKDANIFDNFENSDSDWVHTVASDRTEKSSERFTGVKDFPVDTRKPQPSSSAEVNLDFPDQTLKKESSPYVAMDQHPHGLGSLLTNKIISGPQGGTKLKSDLPSAKGQHGSSLKKRKSWETFGNKVTPSKSRKTGTAMSVTPVRLSISGMSLDNQNSDDDFQ